MMSRLRILSFALVLGGIVGWIQSNDVSASAAVPLQRFTCEDAGLCLGGNSCEGLYWSYAGGCNMVCWVPGEEPLEIVPGPPTPCNDDLEE